MAWKTIGVARQRLRKERGTVLKDWGGRIAVALIYPNSYYVGMSSLGFQTVYGLLNSYEQVVCERVFWEPGRGRASEPLSLESQRPLTDFDVLAFSISYELDYLNAVELLRAGRIPLYSDERDETHPLVMAGGPCISANPLPLSLLFDCFAIGEAEAIIPAVVGLLPDGLERKREDFLAELASVQGLYVPAFPESEPVKRQWLEDLDSVATTSVVLTPGTEFGDVFLIEIARGCGRGCRFCLTGYNSLPFRYRLPDSIAAQAEKGLRYGSRIGLLAAAVSDHPRIDELVTTLRRMEARLSVSSLRVRPLSDTLLRELAASGAESVALAPEAGAERLRQVVSKGITEDDILRAADLAAGAGFRQIKLYFMVGLPTESDGDAGEIITLSRMLKERVEKRGCRIALSVEPFVPKAGTPFQWLPMADAQTLDRRLKLIRSSLAGSGIEVRTESVGWSLVQGILSKGNASLGGVLAGLSGTSLGAWRRALAQQGLSPEDYIHRELRADETLPWSVIDSGVPCECLRDELKEARRTAGQEWWPRNGCGVS